MSEPIDPPRDDPATTSAATPPEPPEPPEPLARRRGRRVLRIAAWTSAGLFALLIVVIGAAAWLLGREPTLQRIVAEVEKRLDGQLHVVGVRGSLYRHIEFDRLVFRTRTQVFTVEKGRVDYSLAPLERRFTIGQAHVDRLTVETIAKSDEPTVEPDSLELPAALRLDTLRLDDAHVDAVDLVQGGKTTSLTDVDLRARYATEGGSRRWIVDRAAVATPYGRASGQLTLVATRPFAIDGHLLAEGSAGDVPYRAPLVIGGRLADLEITSDFTVSDPTAQAVPGRAEARVLPFRDQPIDHATLHVAGVSPKRWKDTLPEADITVDARLVPTGGPAATAAAAAGVANPFEATLSLTNAMPGPIDRQRIPLVALEAALSGDSASLSIARLSADLGAAGKLDGRGAYVFAGGGTPSFDGSVRNLDLKAIQTTLIPSRFTGPLTIARTAGVLRVDATLKDAGRSVRLKAQMDGDRIRIAEAAVAVGRSRIDASGSIDLSGERSFEVAGDVTHLDPHDFGDFAAADVTASFKLGGAIGATARGRPQQFRVAADLRVAPSRVLNRSVAGTIVGSVAGAITTAASGKTSVAIRKVADAKVALAFGPNRVAAEGAFGGPGDRLAWNIDAPMLADLDASVAGSLRGHGTIGGTLAEPSIEFDVAGDDLRYGKPALSETPAPTAASAGATDKAAARTTVYSLKSLRGQGSLLAGASGLLSADLKLVELRDGGAGKAALVDAANAQVRGTREAHSLTVTASSDRFDVSASADGGLDARNTWRGNVTRLASRGRVPFTLDGGTSIVASADRIEIGAAHLRFDEGQVQLDRLTSEDGTIVTAGRATGFPLSLAGTFSPEFNRQVATSLKFGGQWDLRIGDAIDGKVRLYRESGNVQFLTDPKFSIDPSKLEVSATIVADRLSAQVTAIGNGLGRIEATLDTRLQKRGGQWGLPGDAPLALRSDVDIPDLRWLARLSGRPGLDLQGHLRLAVTGKGTIGDPSLSGSAAGEAIRIRWPDQGLNFTDGRLDVDFDDDRIVVKQASLASGKGTLAGSGELRIADRKVTGKLAVKLDRFEAVSRTDRTMVVSGTGSANFGATGIDVAADLKADSGSLQLAERRGPTMSDDIVVVGRKDADDKVAARSVPVRLSVKFDMGDNFKVKGSGFEGKLGGKIAIVGSGSDLRATGTVSVREGVYTAYGQDLTITRGNLAFSGPIDNPALDIVAVRKNLAVEAGVQISGTALAPVAKLTSTPDVPDTEKLSWLVLGHGLTAGSKSDFALLTTAASSLLGSSDSTSIQSRIAATLGVDEIGVSGLGGDTGGLLTVGKQISEKLRVTLEQGFTKAATLVKVRYRVFNHVDLQVQTGTESALDVFYTFSFD